MKSSITHISETVVINKPHLTVTFTEEDLFALKQIGCTSQMSRNKFFQEQVNKYTYSDKELTKRTAHCNVLAILLGDLYSAVADFEKELKDVSDKISL